MQKQKMISKFDDRYYERVKEVAEYWSTDALNLYRLRVEICWIRYLVTILPELRDVDLSWLSMEAIDQPKALETMIEIEKTTNHDVKAVELTLAEICRHAGISTVDKAIPFIHIGLTSNDVNSVAYTLQMWDFIDNCFTPLLDETILDLALKSTEWKDVPMLCLTHGQPATPSTFGFQMRVYWERLTQQKECLNLIVRRTKFGGATGGWNAMLIAYPDIDWTDELDRFCKSLWFKRNQFTTQIDHYDNHAEVFDCLARIATVLIDLAWDMWGYISIGYLILRIVSGEVGSSTMPHKVNPIDFENMIANMSEAVRRLHYMSEKLPISRFQRDLTDSSTWRSLGEIMAELVLGFKSLKKGMGKISVNEERMDKKLNKHWEVLGEAVQTVLRKNGHQNAYDLIKVATRNGQKFDQKSYLEMVRELKIDEEDKHRLQALTPQTYLPILNF